MYTSISADAYLFGNRFGLDSLCCQGRSPEFEREIAQLTRPLDRRANVHAEPSGVSRPVPMAIGPGAEVLETPGLGVLANARLSGAATGAQKARRL